MKAFIASGQDRAKTSRLAFAVTIICFLGIVSASAQAADATPRYRPQPWGYDSAAGQCVVCHSLEADGPFRVAPNLFGIVGAEKARESEWYGYSMALKTKGGVWTEEDLDKYLADAPAFAPGTTKTIRVSDPEERRKIIEYLASLH